MRTSLAGIYFFLLCTLLSTTASSQAPDAKATAPTVTFSLDFPNASPPHYFLAVSADGGATYHSDPGSETADGERYEYPFTISGENREKIFQGAKQLKYFDQDFEYRKSKIAFTGNKTLAYKDGDRQFHTTYNWSANTAVQQLTNLFENIAETMEFGRRLTYFHAHDKLGLDEELKRMQEMAKDHQLAEIQAITPILKSIAADGSVMNMSRRRAEALLSTVSPAA